MNSISEKSNKKPEISVLLPVYNAEKWIVRTVNSVLSQDFSDFELVCIDGSRHGGIIRISAVGTHCGENIIFIAGDSGKCCGDCSQRRVRYAGG